MRTPLFFVLSFLCIVLCACTKDDDRLLIDNITINSVSVKSGNNYEMHDYNLYLVNESDIEHYKHFMNTIQDSEHGQVVEVIPVQKDSLLDYYIFNFENGWQIISADKRGPIVLANSQEGAFIPSEINPGIQTWIDMLADDIAYRRYCPNDYYSRLDKNGEDCEMYSLNTWKAITADSVFISSSIPITKEHGLTPNGHYELDYSYVTVEVNTVLTHLLSTIWHQDYPFNEFIPFKSGSTTERCPAGCVTIAAAQVLYYLHYFLGYPIYSPASGYCIGDRHSFNMFFYNYLSTPWSNMFLSSDPYGYAALMIGDIATHVVQSFGDTGTSGKFIKIHNSAFPFYGIDSSCQYSYDSDIVYNNLRDSLPVLFTGHHINIEEVAGHTFVIDGYDDEVTVTHYVYTWVLDPLPEPGGGDPEMPVPILPPIMPEEIVVSSPVVKHFYLNWGYGSIDNAQYATNGCWTHGNNCYQYLRKMIYDYEVI